ncbi:MAG: hypothetical protein R3E97_10855 [Candidatus Eisenbacteria bacterium]
MKRMSAHRGLGVALALCGLSLSAEPVAFATQAFAGLASELPMAFAASASVVGRTSAGLGAATSAGAGADADLPPGPQADGDAFTQAIDWDGVHGLLARQFETGDSRLGGAGDPVDRWDQGFSSGRPSSSKNYNRSAIVTTLLLPGLAQYRLGEKGAALRS